MIHYFLPHFCLCIFNFDVVMCQGHGCDCKRQVMRPDPQHKPYEALRVQSRGKCWSPSDIENNFKRVKWRCSMSKQRAGCMQDQMDEQRCGWKQTGKPRGEWKWCVSTERQAEG